MKLIKLSIAALLLAFPSAAWAQYEGPRVDWPLPRMTNVVGVTYADADANAAFTVLNRVEPEVEIESNVFILSYTRSQPIFDRTVHWQLQMPIGNVDTDSNLPIPAGRSFRDGVGDLTFGATVNLIGAPDLPVREALRYDLDTTVGLGISVTAPTGTYESDEVLNLGSNQWSARVSVPIIKSLGDWVPGRRMTLEVKPSVRFFGNNSNSFGETIEQDPLLALEAHLTRDLTKDAFISLDYNLIEGGDQTFTDSSTGMLVEERDGPGAQSLGFTFGYTVNENLSLFVGHHQTIAESSNPFELRGSLTTVRLTWSWHPVLQRRSDFQD